MKQQQSIERISSIIVKGADEAAAQRRWSNECSTLQV